MIISYWSSVTNTTWVFKRILQSSFLFFRWCVRCIKNVTSSMRISANTTCYGTETKCILSMWASQWNPCTRMLSSFCTVTAETSRHSLRSSEYKWRQLKTCLTGFQNWIYRLTQRKTLCPRYRRLVMPVETGSNYVGSWWEFAVTRSWLGAMLDVFPTQSCLLLKRKHSQNTHSFIFSTVKLKNNALCENLWLPTLIDSRLIRA